MAASGKTALPKGPPPAPPPLSDVDETAIARERLITRETVFLGRSAKKAMAKFASFVHAIEPTQAKPEAQIASLGEAALCELGLFAVEVRKTAAQARSCERELADADAGEATLRRAVEDAKAEITALRAKLAAARQSRRRREECEALAKAARRHPSTGASSAALAALNAQLAAVDARCEALGAYRRATSMRFAVLVESIEELRRQELEGLDEPLRSELLGGDTGGSTTPSKDADDLLEGPSGGGGASRAASGGGGLGGEATSSDHKTSSQPTETPASPTTTTSKEAVPRSGSKKKAHHAAEADEEAGEIAEADPPPSKRARTGL